MKTLVRMRELPKSKSPVYRKDIVKAELRGDWCHLRTVKSGSTSYKVKK